MKTRLMFLLVVAFISACQNEPEILPLEQNPDNNIPIEQPAGEWMYIRTKLEMTLGGIYYSDITAPVIVKAFDSDQVQQWEEQFIYSGPNENDLKLKTGFKTYKVTFSKWGKTLTQTFNGDDLWKDRVREGAVPVTKVFQGNAVPKQLLRIVTKRSNPTTEDEEGIALLIPVNKTTYGWNAQGQLKNMNYYNFDEGSGAYTARLVTELNYENGRVANMITYPIGTMQSTERQDFTYDEQGRTTHVKHHNFGVGITTDVSLSYEFNDRLIKATYNLSNGNGFHYESSFQDGSMKADKTMRGSQLCSTGSFTSDKGVNPLRHLGYVDYLLRNVSANNRITEKMSYVGCAFPTLEAERYEYTYDSDGYPIRSITHFKRTNMVQIKEYTYDE